MQGTGCVEQAPYVSGSSLIPEPADGDEVVSVPAVFPAALFGDGLEDLGGGAPALFGGLRQVAGGQFLLGPRTAGWLADRLEFWYENRRKTSSGGQRT